jgi:hypothetical protein
MPMQAESLEVLEKAQVAPAQARAFVRAIEIEIAGAKDTLATKHDLLALRADLRAEIGELRVQVTDQIGQFRVEVADQIAHLRVEVADQIGKLRADMAKELGALRGELHSSLGSVVRQMYLAILGQMAVMLGFAYFFATHLR